MLLQLRRFSSLSILCITSKQKFLFRSKITLKLHDNFFNNNCERLLKMVLFLGEITL